MIAVVAWLLSGAANAGTPPDATTVQARVAQAQELYRLGAGLYKAGRYREAIGSFREAYELSGNVKLLYNIANAQERLGDLQGAIESLRAYRPHAPVADVVSLDLRIAALEDRLAETVPEPEPEPAPVVVPAPPPPEPETVVRRRPRWELVGGGAALAAGFGAAAAVTWLQGQDDVTAGDEASYRVNRTVNNLAIPLAGASGGLAVIGFALPRQQTITVSATPRGAGLRVRF